MRRRKYKLHDERSKSFEFRESIAEFSFRQSSFALKHRSVSENNILEALRNVSLNESSSKSSDDIMEAVGELKKIQPRLEEMIEHSASSSTVMHKQIKDLCKRKRRESEGDSSDLRKAVETTVGLKDVIKCLSAQDMKKNKNDRQNVTIS